jgi:hypothetical protein
VLRGIIFQMTPLLNNDVHIPGIRFAPSGLRLLLSQARDAGYSRMRLDTSHQQVAAFGLYKSLGFKEIQPYYEAPEEVRANLTFMEIALQSQLSASRQ